MIRKIIKELENVEVYFLFKDCKKLIKKYYGKKADELGKPYARDVDKIMKKYWCSEVYRNIVLNTMIRIESYDKEAYEESCKEVLNIIRSIKSAPDGAATPSQGNETR